MHKVKPLALLISLGIALIFWNLPLPEALNPHAWQLLSIFIGTIVAIIANALPMGALALISVAVLSLTQTLTIEQALSGFSNKVVWLVVAAFFIARGFIKTGLGMRIAYFLISIFGKSSLGLAYSLALAETILAPVIPSNTARGGGVIFPIAKSLALSFESSPESNSERALGSFLLFTAYQCNLITSALFLTAMAANPLIVEIASGMGIDISWGEWTLAALLPALISLLVIPLFIYKLYPPTIKSTPDAPKKAKEVLKKMGKIKQQEWIMIFVFSFLLLSWMIGDSLFGIDSTTTAFIGLSMLLLTKVLSFKDIKQEEGAWDTLIWFSILITMASYLNTFGLIEWASKEVSVMISSMAWPYAFITLFLLYFYSHYLFASNTAHVTSMCAAFLGIGIVSGVPGKLMALMLGFSSSLFSSITHYATGPAPVYFGADYISLSTWWRLGFFISIINIFIWVSIGSLWTRFLGIW